MDVNKDLFKTVNINSPSFYEDEFPLEWSMTRNDKFGLIMLLQKLRPQVSIEIGTFRGGSTQVISKFSEKVFSIDPKKDSKKNLQDKFNNVTFFTGYSYNIIPQIFKELDETNEIIEFILIDGDHSTESVKNDINLCLQYIPKKPLFIVFHDSFNPACRKGIKLADYQNSLYVHYVELDFVNGVFNPGKIKNEMWGGLALVVMLPIKRENNIHIHESQKKIFRSMYYHSFHFWLGWKKYLKGRKALVKKNKDQTTKLLFIVRKKLSSIKQYFIRILNDTR